MISTSGRHTSRVAKFRKKPVVIEATQWDGGYVDSQRIQRWVGSNCKVNTVSGSPLPKLTIETLEGAMAADENDWIIKGIKGEFYPCKPDIFEATYEQVD